MHINRVSARTISDTRGRKTIETTLFTDEFEATASIPSGKSTGSKEAKELRDEDGSVTTAIHNVTGEIATVLSEHNFSTIRELDTFLCELDGTQDKSRLGANAILSVSIAMSRLFAQEAHIPLWRFIADTAGTTPASPRLFVNVMNGGAHAGFRLPIQEQILVIGEKTLKESVTVAHEAFSELGDMLRNELVDLPMGDEGGYSPSFDTIERPFELLSTIVSKRNNTSIAIDSAANELLDGNEYVLLKKRYTPTQLLELYTQLVKRFHFHAIEDPFAESDKQSFAEITKKLGKEVIIIGDDLIVTNPKLIEDAVEHKYINATLIKPNQIGTVSQTIDAVHKTYDAGWRAVVSHRSGETYDTFIADLAYGIGAHGIKAGGLAQQQRLAKYERLRTIECEATELSD